MDLGQAGWVEASKPTFSGAKQHKVVGDFENPPHLGFTFVSLLVNMAVI